MTDARDKIARWAHKRLNQAHRISADALEVEADLRHHYKTIGDDVPPEVEQIIIHLRYLRSTVRGVAEALDLRSHPMTRPTVTFEISQCEPMPEGPEREALLREHLT